MKGATIPWQDDTQFVTWLYARQYAAEVRGKPKPYLTLGCVLYMYEAWTAAGRLAYSAE